MHNIFLVFSRTWGKGIGTLLDLYLNSSIITSNQIQPLSICVHLYNPDITCTIF